MTFASKLDFLSFRPPVREFKLADLGDKVVRLKGLTVLRRTDLHAAILKREADIEEDAKLKSFDNAIITILFSIVDQDANWMFDENDYPAFEQLPYPAVAALFSAVTDLNTIHPLQSAEIIETLKKSSK